MEADEEIGGGDGANGDGGSKLPDAKVVSVDRVRGRVGVDEVGNKEGDGGLVESVSHEGEEFGTGVLEALDPATVELRNGLRGG